MSYLETNFCSEEEGLDYIFGRMSAIYGSAFLRHWEGVNSSLVRQEWKSQLGVFLTYRPKMDYAIGCMNADHPPSAIKFKGFCLDGPPIPTKVLMVENKLTIHQQIEQQRKKHEAMEKLRQLKEAWTKK